MVSVVTPRYMNSPHRYGEVSEGPDAFPGSEMDSSALGMSGRPSITVSDRQDLEDPCAFPNIVMDARQSTWFGAAGQVSQQGSDLEGSGAFQNVEMDVMSRQSRRLICQTAHGSLSTNSVKPAQAVSVSKARPRASRFQLRSGGTLASDEHNDTLRARRKDSTLNPTKFTSSAPSRAEHRLHAVLP